MKIGIHPKLVFSFSCVNSYCGKEVFVTSERIARIRKYCSQDCFGLVRKSHFESIYGGDTRKCRACNLEKCKSEFSKDGRVTHKRQTICKPCKAKWMREDRIKNPDKYKWQDTRLNYGMTPSQYWVFFKEQGGVCAICKKQETSKRGWLHVDHHHLTGKVRGLLCGKCNSGIGLFGEDKTVLASAIQYLTGGR